MHIYRNNIDKKYMPYVLLSGPMPGFNHYLLAEKSLVWQDKCLNIYIHKLIEYYLIYCC